MSEVVIAEATMDDLVSIGELWRELQLSSAAYEPRLSPNSKGTSWFLNFIQEYLGSDTVAVYIAKVDGVVIGYTFGQILRRPTLQSGDCGYVADLCVQKNWRGQGVGRSLYQRLHAWFVANGVCAVEVQVVRANPASQTFWRKMGFDDFLRTLRKDL